MLDGSSVHVAVIPELIDGGYDQAQFEDWLREVSEYFTVPFPGKARDVYEALRFYYSPWGQRNDKDANRDKLNEVGCPFCQ